MTSNIGSQYLLEGVTDAGGIREPARESVMRELRNHFRPEFLNRVDDTILFKPLTLEEIKIIVDLQVEHLSARLEEQGIKMTLDDSAREFVARNAYDPVYGARPLKRYLQRELETRLGRAIIAGELAEGATVNIAQQNGGLGLEIG